MSLVLCLSSAGLHRDVTIDPVVVELRKILNGPGPPVDFLDNWRGLVVVPKLLLGLAYFVDAHSIDGSFINDMKADFERRPDFARHHLLFSCPGDPLIPLTMDDIQSLLSRAMIQAIADDRPAKLTLHVRFRGSSEKHLLDGLRLVRPVVSRPTSPTTTYPDATTPEALHDLGSAILKAIDQMSMSPAIISPTSPRFLPSATSNAPSSPDALHDVSIRSAFLAYRGLDHATSRSAVPTPSSTFLRLPNGTITRDMFSASHPLRSARSVPSPAHTLPRHSTLSERVSTEHARSVFSASRPLRPARSIPSPDRAVSRHSTLGERVSAEHAPMLDTKYEDSPPASSHPHLSPDGPPDAHHTSTHGPHGDRHGHVGGDGGDDDGDPPWNANTRAGFRYAPGREALLATRGVPLPVHGTTWTHYYHDPQALDLVIDNDTGLIPPWFASRPDYGRILNHPVPNEVRFMDRSLYLSGFQRAYEVKNNRYFMGNFPAFSPGSSFTSWHCRIVSYCHPWGIFVPPLQTLRDNDSLGAWFPYLPPWVREAVTHDFDGLLAICLKSKYTGLSSEPAYARIVQLHEGGYQALYDLAVHAGHPMLQTYPTSPREPLQSTDCCLADHILHWMTYVQDMALRGTHLSDRYFLEQFGRSLHVVLRPFADYLDHGANRFPVGNPLPHSFAPHRLLSKLTQRAHFLRAPKLISDSPRSYATSTQAIRSLTLPSPSPPSLALPSSDPLFLAALSSPDRACFLCASTDHLVPACPRFQAIMENQFARRNLSRLLTSSDNKDKHVRMLGADDAVNEESPAHSGEDVLPGSASPVDLPDDELSDFQ